MKAIGGALPIVIGFALGVWFALGQAGPSGLDVCEAICGAPAGVDRDNLCVCDDGDP